MSDPFDNGETCEFELEVLNMNPEYPLYMKPECPAPAMRLTGRVQRFTAESDYKEQAWFTAEWWVCAFHLAGFVRELERYGVTSIYAPD